MYKYAPTIVLIDETKSLFFTKPLYSSLCHSPDLLSRPLNYGPRPWEATLTKQWIPQGETDPQISQKLIALFIFTGNLKKVALGMSREKKGF